MRRGFSLHCEYCGTEYAPGEELELPEGVSVDIHQHVDRVADGDTVIGVSFNLGNLDQGGDWGCTDGVSTGPGGDVHGLWDPVPVGYGGSLHGRIYGM